jgi:hypothetical protein
MAFTLMVVFMLSQKSPRDVTLLVIKDSRWHLDDISAYSIATRTCQYTLCRFGYRHFLASSGLHGDLSFPLSHS